MPTPKKSAEIDLIAEKLRDASAAILTDYRGLNVPALATLRGQLRPSGAEFRIVKNTLARIAAERVGLASLVPLLEGPTAIAFASDDVAAPAKVLSDFARTSRVLSIKGALLAGRTLTTAEVGALAELPSKPQLQAQLVGNIQGVLAGVVGVLDGVLASLVYTLEARAEQQNAA